jgi:predicted ATP-binding protein involved in virulence
VKLDKVDITYFRCFESLSIPLQPDVNVLVGVNGAGKSAILDAIAIALWDVVAANGGGGKRERNRQGVALRPSDIHITPESTDLISGRREFVQVRASVKDFYEIAGFPAKTTDDKPMSIEWQDHIQFRPPRDFDYSTSQSNELSAIYSYFENLWAQIGTSDVKALIPLPVVAYYRAHRRLSEMPYLGDIFSLDLERAGAFQGALNAGASYDAMCQWFYLRENQELREKLQIRSDREFELADLKAVRSALTRALENVEKVFFSDNPPSLKVAMREPRGTPKVLELDQLSDGYRNLLAVVLDFARRLAQANPGWENPLKAPGILLIDEIELHLHPHWQQTVIPSLTEVFPNTQLILTTHSPQILTTVRSRSILILRDQQVFTAPPDTYGAESKRVLEQVLQTESRPPGNENVNDLRKLFALITRGSLTDAEQLLTKLIEQMGSDEPALVEAQTIIHNREWEKELGL